MQTVTIPQAFEVALQHHRAGRLSDAEAIYRQILAQEPNHPDALHHLGIIAHQAGRNDVAEKLIRQAIALSPGAPSFHSNLGLALGDQGRTDEAIAAFRAAIELRPNFPQAHNNLGTALKKRGQTAEAIAAYLKAIEIDPGFAEACNNLGVELTGQRRLEEALAAFDKALQIKPDYAEAYNNLGNALKEQGELDEAITAYRTALELKPEFAGFHNNLGSALKARGRLDEAVAAHRRAMQLEPDNAEAHNNLAGALKDQGQLDEAFAACRRAIDLNPEYAEAHNNLGNVLLDQGRLDEGLAAYKRALQLKPDFPEVHNNLGTAYLECGRLDESESFYKRASQSNPEYGFNYSFLLLLRGEFERAWPLYEGRWDAAGFASPKRNFSQPMWDGGPLSGQRVLIHAEQGFGDSIQFIRYAPRIVARGGIVVVECQQALVELFRTAKGVSEVVAAGEPLPPFDFHVPMLSQPLVFKTTLETIPGEVHYLTADAERCEAWRQKIGSDRSRLKVGVVWGGNPANPGDRTRSIRLEKLLPLLRVEGVDFFSLQKGRGSEQIRDLPESARVTDPTESLTSFAETAALLMELDLVISVDTAIIHLAGALGRPVWALLAFAPDWRWMLQRSDSPWYPTLHLFRQSQLMDWDSVIAKVRDRLELLANRDTFQCKQ